MTPLVPLPALIADIGGTNGRFALVGSDGALVAAPILRTREHADFPSAIGAVIAALPERPRSAVFAMAAVVADDRAALTNGPWVAQPRQLMAMFGLSEVAIVNDFEALANALPSLADDDLAVIHDAPAEPSATKIVVGPGTGLGAAALIRVGQSWAAVGGEGGHIEFGPKSAEDDRLWPHLERIGGRISAEWLVSGPGLVRLYRAIAARVGKPIALATPAEVTAAADRDPVAAEALRLFVRYLGRYAGDIALVFMPKGGVYLGGGIARRILPLLRAGDFHAAFVDKAPHNAVMERFRIAAIIHPAPALPGLAAIIRSPDQFALNLTGRHWR